MFNHLWACCTANSTFYTVLHVAHVFPVHDITSRQLLSSHWATQILLKHSTLMTALQANTVERVSTPTATRGNRSKTYFLNSPRTTSTITLFIQDLNVIENVIKAPSYLDMSPHRFEVIMGDRMLLKEQLCGNKFKRFHCTLVENVLLGLNLDRIYYCKLHLWVSLDCVCLWLISHAIEIDRFASHQRLASPLPQITLGGLVALGLLPSHMPACTYHHLEFKLFSAISPCADTAQCQTCQTARRTHLWHHVGYLLPKCLLQTSSMKGSNEEKWM